MIMPCRCIVGLSSYHDDYYGCDGMLTSINLKVYTPPNAATHGFSIFDDKTGKACHIKTSHVYSVRGERC